MGRIDFEARYEHQLARKEKSAKKVKELLPIKTNGSLRTQIIEEDDVPEEEVEDEEEEYEDVPVDVLDEIVENGDLRNDDEPEESHKHINKVFSTAGLLANRRQKLAEYKVKMGILSASFLEDPENRLKNLDSLLTMLDIVDPAIALTVPKFAAVSLQAVFADVLPSYPIKHHNPEGVKQKMETRERQGYEDQLLKRYKIYLQKLEKMVARNIPRRKPKSALLESQIKLGRISLDCMCRMLLTHPYFNLSVNITNFIIPFLNNWNPDVRKVLVDTLKVVFRNDKRGEISYEIVRRVNALVKTNMSKGRSGNIRREVLDVLLGLRIKEADLEKEKEEEMKPTGKMTFEQRRMLSKKQRKKAKDLVKLERELLEASAEENKSRKSHFLTEITKLVFTLYFRALKTNPRPQMLTAVLEGLAKFAHLINIHFFGDLLKVLQGLLTAEGIHEHQKLLCVSTVLTVLSGQGSALAIDPVVFHRHLYEALINLRCGVRQSDADVAVRCCQLATGRNKMPAPRAVAFAKRISTVATQVEYHDALALLLQLKHVLRNHPASAGLLDTDGVNSSGVYLPELDDPDHCCAQATNFWEMTTLLFHYHPWVRQIVRSIVDPEKIEPVPQEIGQKKPEDVCIELNPFPSMDFIPAPPRRNGPPPAKKARTTQYRPKTDYFTEDNYINEFMAEEDSALEKVQFL